MTSADVAFSILRLKEAHPRGRATFSQVESVDTSDPLVARIRLARPSPGLITALAASESPIVPKHIFETFKPTENPKPEQIVGSGPFVPALIDVVLYGYAVASPTPIGPGPAKFHNPDIPFAAFDPKLSEKLLDEAGIRRCRDEALGQLGG